MPRSVRESKRIIFKEENDVHYFERYAYEEEVPTEAEEVSEEVASPEVGVQQMVTTVDKNCCAFMH